MHGSAPLAQQYEFSCAPAKFAVQEQPLPGCDGTRTGSLVGKALTPQVFLAQPPMACRLQKRRWKFAIAMRLTVAAVASDTKIAHAHHAARAHALKGAADRGSTQPFASLLEDVDAQMQAATTDKPTAPQAKTDKPAAPDKADAAKAAQPTDDEKPAAADQPPEPTKAVVEAKAAETDDAAVISADPQQPATDTDVTKPATANAASADATQPQIVDVPQIPVVVPPPLKAIDGQAEVKSDDAAPADAAPVQVAQAPATPTPTVSQAPTMTAALTTQPQTAKAGDAKPQTDTQTTPVATDVAPEEPATPTVQATMPLVPKAKATDNKPAATTQTPVESATTDATADVDTAKTAAAPQDQAKPGGETGAKPAAPAAHVVRPEELNEHRSARNEQAGDNSTLTAVDATRAADVTQTLSASSSSSTSAATATTGAAATAAPTGMANTVPVQGLAVEIAARAQKGSNNFEIRLDPPELGRIEVQLKVDRDGQVKSHLVVDRADTLDLLRRDAPQLERALQDAGLKTSDNSLQFSLRDQTAGGNERQSGPSNNGNSGTVIAGDDTLPSIEATQRSYARLASLRGGIDIRI